MGRLYVCALSTVTALGVKTPATPLWPLVRSVFAIINHLVRAAYYPPEQQENQPTGWFSHVHIQWS